MQGSIITLPREEGSICFSAKEQEVFHSLTLTSESTQERKGFLIFSSLWNVFFHRIHTHRTLLKHDVLTSSFFQKGGRGQTPSWAGCTTSTRAYVSSPFRTKQIMVRQWGARGHRLDLWYRIQHFNLLSSLVTSCSLTGFVLSKCMMPNYLCLALGQQARILNSSWIISVYKFLLVLTVICCDVQREDILVYLQPHPQLESHKYFTKLGRIVYSLDNFMTANTLAELFAPLPDNPCILEFHSSLYQLVLNFFTCLLNSIECLKLLSICKKLSFT